LSACEIGDARVTYNHMVVGVFRPERIDRLFHALGDATRRDIVGVVLSNEQSVSALARRYPMSFAAVQKHVAVLEQAGLVTKRRLGREQLVRGNIDALHQAHRLLDQLEVLWRLRLTQLDEILSETNQGASP
jgi:DNA-binding transcriptional ArsR family regulator